MMYMTGAVATLSKFIVKIGYSLIDLPLIY